MAENAFMTFVRGFKQLKKHPVLFAPGVLYYIAAASLVVIFNFLFHSDLVENSDSIFHSVLSVIFIILIMLLSSFTTAGSIGMSKEVVETGRTSFRYLFSYGKKYGLRLILSTLFITLLRLATAFFWAPVLQIFRNSDYTAEFVINALKTDPSLLPMLDVLSMLVLFAVFTSAVYLLIISFLFYFISYIIVIDDMKVFKSYRTSFKFLRRRPIRVSSFVFLVTAVEVSVTFASVFSMSVLGYLSLPLYFGFFIYMVGSLFLAAAMHIWVTRFYMILTGKDCAPVSV